MAGCSQKEIHLTHPVHPTDMATLKKWFSEFDANADGFISKDEIAKVINSLHKSIPDNELDEMIRLVDKDHNGLVDFNEFIELMDSNCLVQSEDVEMVELFRAFDQNNDGYITEEEIANVLLITLGENVRKKHIRKMLKIADKNNDKKISFIEFKEMVESGKFI